MKDLVAKINAEIETFKTESEALAEKGVKAAGARARKSSLEIEKLLKEFRKVSIEESKKQLFQKAFDLEGFCLILSNTLNKFWH